MLEEALDPQQLEVATRFGRPLVVLAGAGTGKTRAITHRIAHAAHRKLQDPAATLAVTFTTRAAGEMRARLSQLGVPQAQARTFHSAALLQLRHFWPEAYGAQLPALVENRFGLVAEAASRLQLGSETSLLRDLGAEISWSKVSNVSAGEYPGLARASGRSVGDLDPTQVARVITEYEATKQARSSIDFEDILLLTVAMLHEHPDVAEQVRQRYRHFVVDEYQDVSPLQQSLLEAWLGDRDDICVVGDPNQSIHAYAGADPRFLTTFTSRFPDADVVSLVRNYRSVPEVIQLANNVLAKAPAGAVALRQPLQATRTSTGPGAIEFVGHSADTDEATAIAQWLRDRHAEGMAWNELAVLYRINAQSPVLEAALTTARVPYSVKGTERFFERGEIRQLLRRLEQASTSDPDADALAGFNEVLGASGWTSTAPNGSGAVRERWESLGALRDLAIELHTERPGLTLVQLREEFTQRAAQQHAPVGQAVTLATLHAAKGMEWQGVALAGMSEGGVPFALATTPEAIEEERRLLYVGVTRAKDRLRISWSHHGGPGRSGRTLSSFLRGLGPAGASAPVRTSTRTAAGTGRSRRAPRCSVCHQVLSHGTERKLGHHEQCEVAHDEAVFEALKAWRMQAAEGRPAYVVFTDATLLVIAERLPTSAEQLGAVPGVGPAKLERYGSAVLEVVASARSGQNASS